MRTPILVAALLSGCAPTSEPPPQEPRAEAPAPEPPPAEVEPAQMLGFWRIAAVNGVAPESLLEDAGRRRVPRLIFTDTTYGGTTGCNFFGGLGLLEGGRYYTAPGPQTAMGCGGLTAQEQRITGVLGRSPAVAAGGDDRLELRAGEDVLLLRRDSALAADLRMPQGRSLPPPALAGSRWRLLSADGSFWAEKGLSLHFEPQAWTLDGPCGRWSGRWRRQGDRIEALEAPTTARRACPVETERTAQAVAAILASGGRFAVGPNGEFLLAGGGHWAVGERSR